MRTSSPSAASRTARGAAGRRSPIEATGPRSTGGPAAAATRSHRPSRRSSSARTRTRSSCRRKAAFSASTISTGTAGCSRRSCPAGGLTRSTTSTNRVRTAETRCWPVFSRTRLGARTSTNGAIRPCSSTARSKARGRRARRTDEARMSRNRTSSSTGRLRALRIAGAIRPEVVIAAGVAAGIVIALLWSRHVTDDAPTARADRHWDVLETYCFDCHNAVDRAGDLVLDRLEPDNVPDDAATWEKVVRKLRGRTMPPPGQPRPSDAEYSETVAWLETTLDDAAAGRLRPGWTGLHRLNRREYANAIYD